MGHPPAPPCAGFAPSASPPWPGSGPRPPPASEPRGGGWGIRRPHRARGSPRRLRRRGPAPGRALRRLPNPAEADGASAGPTVRGVRPVGFAAVARLRARPPPASEPRGGGWGIRRHHRARGSPRRLRRRGPAPGSALRRLPNPAEADGASAGPTVRGVRPVGFAAVARLRAPPSTGFRTPRRRTGHPPAPPCAGFAPSASPPWPGSGLRPPPASEPRGGGLPSQAHSTRLNVQPGRLSLARSPPRRSGGRRRGPNSD
jgi:hypothetical protein